MSKDYAESLRKEMASGREAHPISAPTEPVVVRSVATQVREGEQHETMNNHTVLSIDHTMEKADGSVPDLREEVVTSDPLPNVEDQLVNAVSPSHPQRYESLRNGDIAENAPLTKLTTEINTTPVPEPCAQLPSGGGIDNRPISGNSSATAETDCCNTASRDVNRNGNMHTIGQGTVIADKEECSQPEANAESNTASRGNMESKESHKERDVNEGMERRQGRKYIRSKKFPTIRKFTCATCSQVVVGLTAYAVHVRFHGRFQCGAPNCERRYNSKAALRKHELTHDANTCFYACGFCSKKFVFQSQLDIHVRKHSNKSIFRCGIGQCLSLFKTQAERNRHEREYHILSHIKHMCTFPACGKEFNTKKQMTDHVRTFHNGVFCRHCGLRFKSRQGRAGHMANCLFNPDRDMELDITG